MQGESLQHLAVCLRDKDAGAGGLHMARLFCNILPLIRGAVRVVYLTQYTVLLHRTSYGVDGLCGIDLCFVLSGRAALRLFFGPYRSSSGSPSLLFYLSCPSPGIQAADASYPGIQADASCPGIQADASCSSLSLGSGFILRRYADVAIGQRCFLVGASRKKKARDRELGT